MLILKILKSRKTVTFVYRVFLALSMLRKAGVLKNIEKILKLYAKFKENLKEKNTES